MTFPSHDQLAALDRCLERAAGSSGGQRRVRSFLLAWWNADIHGGFDLADLWSLDDEWRADVITVFGMIAMSPCGWYADKYGPERGTKMRALAERYAPNGDRCHVRCPRCDKQVEHWCVNADYLARQLEEKA